MTEKEAKIYLLCLEYWSIQAAKIASLSWINRSTCYDILDWLIRKWVLGMTQQQWTRKYTAVNPSLLFQQLEKQCDAFAWILPMLTAISDKWTTKPKITIYEWIEWIKKAYLDTLTSTTDILAFVGNHVADERIMQRFWNEYVPERVKKQIHAKVILTHSPANRAYHENDKKWYRESRFLIDDSLDFSCEINCYSTNKILIAWYSETDMYWIIIEWEHVSKTLVSIFTYIWSGLWR